MTTTTPRSRAQISYTAYGMAVGFRSVNGEELQPFDDLGEAVQAGWLAAANVIWELATTGRAELPYRPQGESNG